MTRFSIFAAASLLALSMASPGRADEKLTLRGGCPEALGRSDCPAAPHEDTDFPKDAHPGQCFAKVRTEAVYETYSERVMVSPGRSERRTVPAVYEWGERQVLVEPERIERHLIAATYRSVTETVVVSPATVRTEQSEPIYETVSERVMTRPARTEWRRTNVGPDGFLPDGARVQPTGEVVCLVEIPAEYSVVQRQVLKSAGHVVQIPVPAVTRTVTRQAVDQPAHTVETRIPAVYRSEKFRRLVSSERTESVETPPVYSVQQRQRETSPATYGWREVQCDPQNQASVYGQH